MKKAFIATALMSMVAVSLYGQRVKGSDTVIPLSQKEAEGYMKENPSAKLTITGGGSGVGFSALLEGTTDIAQASRQIKFAERQKMKEKGIIAKELIIAYDALAVVVHPSNKVGQLTREQLEGIFTGKIKNWREVGGEDMKIVPYSRETSSGTYEFFKEVVMKNKNYMNGIMSMSATGVIIQSVSQTKGAIGYVGVAYLNKDVKAVSVSFDQGKNFVYPSVQNAKNRTYPIVRPLYYYYDAKTERKVKPFIDYVLSPKGQSIVDQVRFIRIK